MFDAGSLLATQLLTEQNLREPTVCPAASSEGLTSNIDACNLLPLIACLLTGDCPTCPAAGATRNATPLLCGLAPCGRRSSRALAAMSLALLTAGPPPAACRASGAHVRRDPRDVPVQRPPAAVLTIAVTAPMRCACQCTTCCASQEGPVVRPIAKALTSPSAWPSQSMRPGAS